jgi:hypothetical protein
MGRRAINGFTEKSYYENVRYLGMIASNDPLNEGYFKHLVNFNISDTAQSLTPRDGFITTTLVHNTEEISLSTRTIIFRDHHEQVFVVFDFAAPETSYLVDLSTYRLDKYLIPVNEVINNIDASTLVNYLNRQLNITGDAAYYFEHTSFTEQSTLRMIYDEFGVRKYVIQLTIKDTNIDYPFIFEVFYNHTDDVLVCGATPINEHPSFSVKNIASLKDFLPPNFQTIYTDSNRPAGHVNLLGAMYVRDKQTPVNYYNNFVYQADNHQFIPYYELNSATYTVNGTAKWAYRFEITSTQTTSILDRNEKDYIYKSQWRNVDNATPVFSYTNDIVLDQFEDNHYKETDYIFSIFRKETPYVITQPTDSSTPRVPYPVGLSSIQTWLDIYNLAYNQISTINSKESMIKAFENLAALDAPEANFGWAVHVYKLSNQNSKTKHLQYDTAAKVLELRKIINYSTSALRPVASMDAVPQTVTLNAVSYTLENLLTEIRTGTFGEGNITYKIFPLHTRIQYTSGTTTVNEERLYSINALAGGGPSDGDFDFSDVFVEQANLFPLPAPKNQETFQRYNMFGPYSSTHTFKVGNLLMFEPLNTAFIDAPLFLRDKQFYTNGYLVTFYIRPYLLSEIVDLKYSERNLLSEGVWLSTSLSTTRSVQYGLDDLTVTKFPVAAQVDDANAIQQSKDMMIYKEERLVVWYNNTVYLSDRNVYYVFRDINKRSYSERIVKVIEYKNIILVFTVQHLYALYETTFTTGTGEAAVETTFWTTQRVLYNILTDPQYADVIQVFNEMVLFYSSDGQMFLIKPSTMINDETRFTLKYFNKAVNDILLNYDVYIRERFSYYNVNHTFNREDVVIKALVSVNFIKIMYTVPNVMTYILVYDVLNNRYYVYDSLTFHTIRDTMYVDSGDMYLTQANNQTLFTFPYKERLENENMVDITYLDFFTKHPIQTLIDTGNLNLNNHLMKRFRDLHVIFKNINATQVLMNAETVIDDIVAIPYYNEQLEIQEINGARYFIQVPKPGVNEIANLIVVNALNEQATNTLQYALDQGLFENNNMLMDFSDYGATKLLTHRSSILGVGKVFRLKLQFVSKGAYKVQAFGIIFKERRV